MKIFFTTPYEGKKYYQKYIDEIIRIIESSNSAVVSPEKQTVYRKAFTKESLRKYGNKDRAHYEFIRQGIAASDCVIFEASYESFRVGHEATLALMYKKPILVLSQKNDYSQYIIHEKFFGGKYRTASDLALIIKKFLKIVKNQSEQESLQTIEDIVDLNHSAKLSRLRYRASQGQTYFANWAKKQAKEPEVVFKDVLRKLGNLPVQKAWNVFSKIYHEDTPDDIFFGVVKFVDKIFRKQGISKSDSIVDVACGTGSISRLLTTLGYKDITAFDSSRAMLSEAYKLCAHLPSIKILEADIKKISLQKPVKGMVWFDFSSNFALSEKEFSAWVNNLLNNLRKNSVLLFDVRTQSGWNVDFFKQRVNTYETDNFQRVSLHGSDKNLIKLDIFIRIKDAKKAWSPWEREQMVERRWRMLEVKRMVMKIDNAEILGIYGDDFTLLRNQSFEPNLAYFVLRKK